MSTTIDIERQNIITDANKKYLESRENNCYWCGSPLTIQKGYDVTVNAKRICKGVCKQQRFFDTNINENYFFKGCFENEN